MLEGALDFFRRSLPRIVVFDELGPRTGGSEPASIRTLQDAVLKTHDFVAISPGCEQPVLEKLRLA